MSTRYPEKANILLVDDQPNNLIALQAILQDLGENLVTARSADEALSRLLDEDYAAILLDVQMPGLGGLELAGLIRQRERFRHTPIIFLTAYSRDEAHVVQAYGLGAVDYMFKPLVPEIVRAKVAVFVDLYRKSRELERSNADLQQFAYVAAHDLKEPARTVAGLMDLLKRELREKMSPDAAEIMRRAESAARRMQDLIGALLNYAQVDSATQPFEAVDCEKALDDALASLKVAVEESSAQITHDPLPTVIGDPAQMRQLFQNLLGNAVKFKNPHRPHPAIHIASGRRSGEWVFFISDDGIGIDPRMTDKLFRLFQRLHSRDEYPGVGIGLAVCKRIVERHGGRIWLESRPGQGTTVFFALPAEAPAESGGAGGALAQDREKTLG